MGLSVALLLVVALFPSAPPGLSGEGPDVPSAVSRALVFLVEAQEGVGPSEWPYEGVYRVMPYEEDYEGSRQIPYGYRVGGTSISASALIQAPGYLEDEARQAAVQRATKFVIEAIEHPLMSPKYAGGYDVRGWGYVYALDFLMRLERKGWTPKALKKEAKAAAKFYLKSLEAIEIPESGGWSYSRRGSLKKASATSPFMTGPAVQALLAAKQQGYKVSKLVLKRALDALERGRVDSGEVLYAFGKRKAKDPETLPGSMGRMLATEVNLYLGGRSSQLRIRAALDAFFEHWKWLDKRRAQTGTHVKPYGVAPYYFYFAHFQASQAIEQLPGEEREAYRAKLRERLFIVRLEDGTWNDRVFPRTANYGTACTILALTAPGAERPAGSKK